jgi:hypothetical protein
LSEFLAEIGDSGATFDEVADYLRQAEARMGPREAELRIPDPNIGSGNQANEHHEPNELGDPEECPQPTNP